MTTQTTEYKCASCGAVSANADALAKHNLIHNAGKEQGIEQGTKPVLGTSTPQAAGLKCASCGAVSADADALAKHNNLFHRGKQDTTQEAKRPAQDSSWQSPASKTPKA